MTTDHSDSAARGFPGRINPAIDEFWQWWRHVGARDLDRLFTGRSEDGPTDELGRLVAAIHPDLEWEFGPGGDGSRHRFTVTAAGDPFLRADARRWLAAAPEADEVWSFSDLRAPAPSMELGLGGHTFRADECMVSMQIGLSLIHVSVYHPTFALPDTPAEQVVYLLLDSLLGEEAVELWVGGIEASPSPRPASVPLPRLQDEVAALAAELAPNDGHRQWQLLEDKESSTPSFVAVAPPLAPLTAPLSTEYVAATVEYSDRTDQGLPGPSALALLQDFQDGLTHQFADHEKLVAVETGSGQRRFHIYRDPTSHTSSPIDKYLATWADGRTWINFEGDPGWRQVQSFRV
ncbi:DUF695 domain-containing protein [Dietzia cercidiphylli]|uniref:DUF695 domain-containing protein n=1 Tax=Dietzia cercidiphylli TaxID=498199 RepID=UPI00223C114A|nr:DUF695 domain-containing protein [Dietzia cercidiphylli]MCT1513644.1 DUF695 domain-containing protein [Dietzia cercidiphylli]